MYKQIAGFSKSSVITRGFASLKLSDSSDFFEDDTTELSNEWLYSFDSVYGGLYLNCIINL